MFNTYSSGVAKKIDALTRGDLMYWAAPLKLAKDRAKASGRIKGDDDLAAAFNAIREQTDGDNPKSVGRPALNHWINAVRYPSIADLITLCHILDVDISDLLSKSPGVTQLKPQADPAIQQAIDMLQQTDRDGRQRALAAIQIALHGYEPKRGLRKS